MIVYTDAFGRSTANITRRLTQIVPGAFGASAGEATIVSSGGPFGGPYLRIGTGVSAANYSDAVRHVPYPVGSGATFIANFWLNIPVSFANIGSGTVGRANLMNCIQGGTSQSYLRLNTNGTISLCNGSVQATSAAALKQGAWHHIEWKHVLAASGGTSDLRIDGLAAPGFSFSGATRATTSNTWDEFSVGAFGAVGVGGTWDARWGHLIIADGTGSRLNDFMGVVRLDQHFATSDGAHTAFSLSTGSSHFALIDETELNEDTDYIFTTTAGNKDSYGHTNLIVSGATILAAMTWLEARREDAGVAGLKAGWRISGTDYLSAEQSPAGAYTEQGFLFSEDPATTAAWLESAFNSAELIIQKST